MNKLACISMFALIASISFAAQAEPGIDEEGSGWTDDQPATVEAEAEGSVAVDVKVGAGDPAAPETKPASTKPSKPAGSASREPERDRHPKAETGKKKRGAHLHDGFYLRGSLGGGSVLGRGYRYDAMGNRSNYDFRGDAMATDVMVGGTPAHGIVIGGAYLASHAARSREEAGPDGDQGMSFGMFGPFLDYFPDPRGGFHVGGAVGPAAAVSYDPKKPDEPVTAMGFGGSLWVGYDFWIADQWSLGAVARASGARVQSYDYEGAPARARDQLGVGSVALLISGLYH